MVAPQFPSLDLLTTLLGNVVKGIADLNRTIATIFPSTTGATSPTAGASAGYITIMTQDGPKKVQIFEP
jgi:hypothetical protein